MKRLYLGTAALGLGLAACGYGDEGYNNQTAYSEGEGNYAEGGTTYDSTETAAAWPEGARIVVEDDVTYRVMPSGERIVLGPADSRIVVEDGVRYRVDPGGTRVRIDEEGAVFEVDADGVSATVNTQ